jgi:hypothetical protein
LIGLGNLSVQEGGVAESEEGLAQGHQQICVHLKSCLANRDLPDRFVPKLLLGYPKLSSNALQAQRRSVMSKDLPGDERPQVLATQSERHRYMSQPHLVLYHNHPSGS